MTDTEYAWAAGFFDGEGSVHYSEVSKRTPRIVLQVSQVNREPLDRFAEIVGAGTVNGPYIQRNVNASPYFVWSTEGFGKPLRVWTLLGDFMCSIKSEQLKSAFERYNDWMKNPTCEKGHKRKKYNGNKNGYYCPTCRSEAATSRRF